MDAPENEAAPAFWCDAMLGGLARWLRAAGYDAAWVEGIDDKDLVRRALADRRILLTSDRELMRHGAITSELVRALFLPPGMGKLEQLRFVLNGLGLVRLDPRCMACGGELEPIPREAARPEVPPRTFAWRKDFQRCGRCAKVLWRGTHWQRIDALLGSL
jgi:hypothetical protein